VGFHWFWKRKSKRTSPKPKLAPELIILIKEMAKNNRLWGAERICGELLKLDIRVCKRTIQFPERMTQIASTGIQQKIRAAFDAGVKEILLPVDNLKEAQELPSYILDSIKLTSVQTVDEVLRGALVDVVSK
jgi:hypothetical protein